MHDGYTLQQDAQKAIQLGRRRVKTGGVPLGYVEDFDEPKTTLEGFFSILPEKQAG